MSDLDLNGRTASQLVVLPAPAATLAPRQPATPLGLDIDAIDRVACKLGDCSCAEAHATSLVRSLGPKTEGALLRLQRKFGNQYVCSVLSRTLANDDVVDGSDALERSIDQARGQGQGLDHHTRRQMESSFGADFSGVRVHTDSRADEFNNLLSARAFATGRDLFFKQGEYDPGSARGRELLAHELTHVVQQSGNEVRAKLTVSEPDDEHELEADRVAQAVMQREQALGLPEQYEDQEVGRKVDLQAIQRQPETAKPVEDEDDG